MGERGQNGGGELLDQVKRFFVIFGRCSHGMGWYGMVWDVMGDWENKCDVHLKSN